MSGGLLKSTSRLALFAAAGALVGGVSPSMAADLGGDCCADLEERVATLESTTVRKGNNKVSVKLSGQVNRALVWWDDGVDSDVYSVDNHQTSTRFRMTGDAKVSPSMKAGFALEIELNDGAASGKVSGKNSTNPLNNVGSNPAADSLLDLRLANWWLESTQLGRVTVGRDTVSGFGFGAVDFGGINVVAALGGAGQIPPAAFSLRRSDGVATSATWGTVGASTLVGFRGDLIKYSSPSIGGFQVTASWGDDDTWGADARWAGRLGAFSLAVIGGYQYFGSETTRPQGAGNVRDDRRWSVGAGVQHDPTGLFVQGGYLSSTNGNSLGTTQGGTLFTDRSSAEDREQLGVQGGISQNWFGIGKTTLYGEYGQYNDFGINGSTVTNLFGVGIDGAIASSEQTFWGLGIVQKVDAAAMDLYLGYRHHDVDVTGCAAGTATLAACGAAATGVGMQDFDLIMGGARIQF